MTDGIYDIIIVGAGPGGCTSALYCARSGHKTLLLEKLSAGGQMALTEDIENYPGYDDGIDGFLLGERMRLGAERFGAKLLLADVQSFELTQPVKTVVTSEGSFFARSVILAMGASHKPLGLEKEQAFVGNGVHYCAVCDAMRYRGKSVAVVGGGNSAVGDALILSRVCKKVLLLHQNHAPTAQEAILAPLKQATNVEIRADSHVTAILADDALRGLRVLDEATGEAYDVKCDGVFVAIGRVPNTNAVRGQVETDGGGYVLAGESTRTSVDGVFAVGDLRTKTVRQIVTAAGDGACAAHFANVYLTEQSRY